ncbi:cell death abnormality protein 1-like isoform X2 [Mercenaria mercenaria]|nr:cell death abnormality protein 1-like isoform X2 [Mercenaria mercenaria]
MTRNNVPVCAAENGACLKGCSTLDKHGEFCNLTCGSNCKDGTCDWKSGACLHGCTINYFGEFCENMCSISCAPSSDRRCFSRNGTCTEGCFPGYYGPKCLQKCNDNCLNNVCGRENGHCSHGCIQGFTGDTCTYITHSAKQKDNTKSSTDTGAIIGAGIGGAAGMLVIVGGILLIVFCLRGRVRNKENSNSSDPTGERNDDESAPGYAEEARVAAGNGVGNTAAETYQNVQESVTVNTNMYEQLQDRDKSEQQYEMVSDTIYQNTSR